MLRMIMVRQLLVLVGVDAKGQDMQTGMIMERAYTCPPFCGNASELVQ